LLVIHFGILVFAAEVFLFVVGIMTYVLVILFLKNEKLLRFNIS